MTNFDLRSHCLQRGPKLTAFCPKIYTNCVYGEVGLKVASTAPYGLHLKSAHHFLLHILQMSDSLRHILWGQWLCSVLFCQPSPSPLTIQQVMMMFFIDEMTCFGFPEGNENSVVWQLWLAVGAGLYHKMTCQSPVIENHSNPGFRSYVIDVTSSERFLELMWFSLAPVMWIYECD